mgnify:CR=1 FL=1
MVGVADVGIERGRVLDHRGIEIGSCADGEIKGAPVRVAAAQQGLADGALPGRLGWRQADVMTLPRKVWNECYRCPKFPGCNEIAMVIDLAGVPAVGEGRSA